CVSANMLLVCMPHWSHKRCLTATVRTAARRSSSFLPSISTNFSLPQLGQQLPMQFSTQPMQMSVPLQPLHVTGSAPGVWLSWSFVMMSLTLDCWHTGHSRPHVTSPTVICSAVDVHRVTVPGAT